MTTLNPPADICGNIGLGRSRKRKALVTERAKWINSLPDHVSPRRIARALGVSMDIVVAAAPGRYSYTPDTITPPTVARVSLPVVPSIVVTRDRPETDPRAGVVSTPVTRKESPDEDMPATVGFVLGHIRSLHAEVTA